MTIEEITQTLQTVASNQAKHGEMHSRHRSDIAELDRMLELSLQSQNRYDERLAQVSEIMRTLADKQLKNEELFAELAAARERHEVRMGQLEAIYELLEQFVRDFRNETHDHFAETDKKLSALAEAQARTDEQMKRTDKRVDALAQNIVDVTRDIAALTRNITSVNGRVSQIGERLDQVAALQMASAEQIKALASAQARTDEQIGKLLDRNGSTAKPKTRKKVKKADAKRTVKKKGARAK